MRVEVEGVHVQLFCRADGFPRPQVTWLKQDIASDQLIQLEDSKDFKVVRQWFFFKFPFFIEFIPQFLPNGDLMVVGRSVCNPGGCALVCRATNSYGEDEVEIFLYQTRVSSDCLLLK